MEKKSEAVHNGQGYERLERMIAANFSEDQDLLRISFVQECVDINAERSESSL